MLRILVFLYEKILRLRNALYDRGIWRSHRLSSPVVSVGNLTVGGSGKTPMVECLARELHQRSDRKIAILSRGYPRVSSWSEPVVVSDGNSCRATPAEAGDEPVTLAENLISVSAVISHPKRKRSGELAVSELGAQLILLDDGFQHRALARDVNLLLIDSEQLTGNGKLFPLGKLREPLSGLHRADAIIFTRWDEVHRSATEFWAGRLNWTGPVFHARYETSGVIWRNRYSEGGHSPEVFAVCGLASPEQFFETIEGMRFRIKGKKVFRDHHAYTEEDADDILEAARDTGTRVILTTQKDWVKLREFQWREFDVGSLRISVHIEEEEFWDFVLEKIKGPAAA